MAAGRQNAFVANQASIAAVPAEVHAVAVLAAPAAAVMAQHDCLLFYA